MRKVIFSFLAAAAAMVAACKAQSQAAPGADTTAPAAAEPSKAPAATDRPKAKAAKPKPRADAAAAVTGKITAVDNAAMTVTVTSDGKARAFNVTSNTRFTKEGKPATFADAHVGETVTLAAKSVKGGKAEATRVRIGGKAEAPHGKPKAKAGAAQKSKPHKTPTKTEAE